MGKPAKRRRRQAAREEIGARLQNVKASESNVFRYGTLQIENRPTSQHQCSVMWSRKRRSNQQITAKLATIRRRPRMIRQTIRQWADKLLKALQYAVAHSTAVDEALFGAIFGLVLLIILTFLGFFD
jgi:hypothetical protein